MTLFIGFILGYIASQIYWLWKTGALYYFTVSARKLKRKVFGE